MHRDFAPFLYVFFWLGLTVGRLAPGLVDCYVAFLKNTFAPRMKDIFKRNFPLDAGFCFSTSCFLFLFGYIMMKCRLDRIPISFDEIELLRLAQGF